MLANELEKMVFDKRLFDWHMAQKKLKPEDLKKHLDSLPDLSAQAIQLEINENEKADFDTH